MNYGIDWDGGVFAVPDKAAQYLRLASGKSVKVLLYYLKYRKLPEDPADIGVTSEDVEDAVSYWLQVGLFKDGQSEEHHDSGNDGKDAALNQDCDDCDEKKQPVEIIAKKPAEKEIRKLPSQSSKALLPSEIAERVNTCPEVKFMFTTSASELGRVLTFDDQRTLLWIHDHLGIDADAVTLLVGYCRRKGRTSIGKIQKTAEHMFEKELYTHEQIEEELLIMEKADSYAGKLRQIMCLNHELTPNQRVYADEWAQKDIPLCLVEKAYYITIEKKNRADFNYLNGILRKWVEGGVVTAEQADNFDDRPQRDESTHKNESTQKNERSQRMGFRRKADFSCSAEPPSYDLSLINDYADCRVTPC